MAVLPRWGRARPPVSVCVQGAQSLMSERDVCGQFGGRASTGPGSAPLDTLMSFATNPDSTEPEVGVRTGLRQPLPFLEPRWGVSVVCAGHAVGSFVFFRFQTSAFYSCCKWLLFKP